MAFVQFSRVFDAQGSTIRSLLGMPAAKASPAMSIASFPLSLAFSPPVSNSLLQWPE
ncbi:hypothetical protein CPCC7001_16 [Cyanobium sp. PCC 7001]|nr:hypothetical protein CPCC7001_16 [Cyanobium sp. PCC 7001]